MPSARSSTPGAPESVAGAILDLLGELGVSTVFTCPGTTEVPLIEAAAARQAPRIVLATHEGAAVTMADGHARASGELGVAILHANVGLGNGLAAMYAAQVARTPLLVLNGLKARALHEKRTLTFTPGSDAVAAPFCVSAAVVDDPHSTLAIVRSAAERARATAGGPAYVGVPEDILAAPAVAEVSAPPVAAVEGVDPPDLAGAATLLVNARRPLIVVGPGVRTERARSLVAMLAETTAAPLLDPPWRDQECAAVRSDHPHYAGGYRRHDPRQQQADLVVLVGTEAFLEAAPRSDDGLPPDAAVVRLAPVAADPAPGRPGTSVDGPVDLVLDALLAEVSSRAHIAVGAGAERRSWTERLRRAHVEDGRVRREQVLASRSEGLRMAEVAELVAELVAAADVPVVLDPVTATSCLLDALPRRPGALWATGSGSLGWGVGAAVGVALAADRPTLAVVGDGVFQFGVQAVWTAARGVIPVTWLVLDNGGYHAVRAALGRRASPQGEPVGEHDLADIVGLDLDLVGRGFGADGVKVTTVEELQRVLAAVPERERPLVVQVVLQDRVTNPAGS